MCSRTYPYLYWSFEFKAPAARSEELSIDQAILRSIVRKEECIGKMRAIHQYSSTCRDLHMEGLWLYARDMSAYRLYYRYKIKTTIHIWTTQRITEKARELVSNTLNKSVWDVTRDPDTSELHIRNVDDQLIPDMKLYGPVIHYLLLVINLMCSYGSKIETLKDANTFILSNPSVFERERDQARSIALFTAFFGYLVDRGLYKTSYVYPFCYNSASSAEEHALNYPADFISFCLDYGVSKSDLNSIPFYHMFLRSGRLRSSTTLTMVGDVFSSKFPKNPEAW